MAPVNYSAPAEEIDFNQELSPLILHCIAVIKQQQQQ